MASEILKYNWVNAQSLVMWDCFEKLIVFVLISTSAMKSHKICTPTLQDGNPVAVVHELQEEILATFDRQTHWKDW